MHAQGACGHRVARLKRQALKNDAIPGFVTIFRSDGAMICADPAE
jgi:hypothetical protein